MSECEQYYGKHWQCVVVAVLGDSGLTIYVVKTVFAQPKNVSECRVN